MEKITFTSEFYQTLAQNAEYYRTKILPTITEEDRRKKERLKNTSILRGKNVFDNIIKDVNRDELSVFMVEKANEGETSICLKKLFDRKECNNLENFLSSTKDILLNVKFVPHPQKDNYEYEYTPGSCAMWIYWGQEEFKEPGNRESYAERRNKTRGTPAF